MATTQLLTEKLAPFLSCVRNELSTRSPLSLALLGLGTFTAASILVSLVSLLYRVFLSRGTNLKKFGAKKGAWAVVTGASDGIGREFALQLAKAGFNILLASRNPVKLAAVAQEIHDKVGKDVRTHTHAIDFAHADDAAYARFGHALQGLDIGVLVNNVGKSHAMPTDFVDTPADELHDIVAINVNATLRVTALVTPGMVSRHHGLILNIGSFAGSAPSPMLATYSASKAFLATFSAALAAELGPKGITVEHANTYFVVSSMSKIRRPTALIPLPHTYVRAVLASIRAGSAVPFWTHALLDYVMHSVPECVVVAYEHALHRDIRKRALRKKEREAKKA
ncbi:NAD(P)-binding protein [Dentipellis sp. KUC8613]|nr:NAD(P)-binding protein [Dentipellis sp. KUC8613]